MSSTSTSIDIANLKKASSDAVIESLSTYAGRPAQEWMVDGHPARQGQLLTTDGSPLRNFNILSRRYTNQQLAELLAATGPNHCMDGWSYLSRTLECLLAGYLHQARHLAYYAQLRAVLSILAHCGIGIFNTINFVIDNNGDVHRLDAANRRRGMGTHLAVWEAIEAWSNEPPLAQQFLNAIRIQGVTLHDCIQSIWPSASASTLVTEIVSSWGMDIRRGAEDREIRNISSYSPHDLNPIGDKVDDRLILVGELWTTLEPGGGDGFDMLDRHLLRNLLQKIHTTISDDKDFGNGSIFNRFMELDPRIRNIASREFMIGNVESRDPLIMRRAKSTTKGSVDGMICRALLLLRTATGFTKTAFLHAGFAPLEDNVRPWLDVTGTRMGFWHADHPPEEMGELWADVRDAMEDLHVSIAKRPIHQYDWLSTMDISAKYLSQAERACMWGMCQ